MPNKTKNKKTLALLDVHAILHRAYHALPEFESSKGEPTGALYGLCTMLIKLVNDVKPDYIVACYDLPEPTQRHEVYADYKAGRKKIDDNLVTQLERSKDVFTAMHIPMYSSPGFEADDMLGTIVEQVQNMSKGLFDIDIVISSGDMDTMQLVSGDKVRVYTLKKGIKDTIIYNEAGVKERFGFLPKFLTDFKGLRGDPSDNIIGISGIGEKTATELIVNFGSIEDIYNKLKKQPKSFEKAGIKKRIIELLKEGEEEALFSKMLATIRRDAPIHFVLPEKVWREDVDMVKVQKLFAEFEFRQLGVKVAEVLSLDLPANSAGTESPDDIAEVGLLLWVVDSNKKYHAELESLGKQIWKIVGQEFNIASPKQLGEMLFVKMGLKPKNQKKTASGGFSTKESELEKLRDEHPIAGLVLEYRELAKLLGTYIDTIPTQVAEDGRLHADFLQTGTTTGRMGCENPNLQNIPNKTELGLEIRKSFIAEKSYKLVAFDYSQIELRIAAFLSGDKKLLQIFKNGLDVHTAVASEVFAVPPSEVTKDMRRKAKVINFGVMYGMGVTALQKNIGTGREEAKIFLDNYFQKFLGLAEYLEKVKRETAQKGYTETFFGRRRYFPDIRSKLPFMRASAERMAVNAPIQGTEADIIKLAMIEIDQFLESRDLKKDVKLLLQVHDELVYEVNEEVVKSIAPEIQKIME